MGWGGGPVVSTCWQQEGPDLTGGQRWTTMARTRRPRAGGSIGCSTGVV
jgi:hypothetical protein